MSDSVQSEEHREAQVEATAAVLVIIALQVSFAVVNVAAGWTTWGLPGWLWLLPVIPELGLLIVLTVHIQRHGSAQTERRRHMALALVAVVAVANVLALIVLIGSLVQAHETNGRALLLKGAMIWTTNIVTFGLIFWELDRGGPVRRREADPPPRDFQFPQDENPSLARPGWYPRLMDYVYVSFTNAIAFSPTDAMPLSRRAKKLMLAESAVSAVTVLLVAARAVNILR